MISPRQIAQMDNKPTYRSPKRCFYDGTYIHDTATGKCSECESYRKAVESRRVNGVDNSAGPRLIKEAGYEDEWCEEERVEHGRKVKKGIARKKNLKAPHFSTLTPKKSNIHKERPHGK